MGNFPEIKVCGVNDARFARRAEELGADYLGFIFAARSPRRVTPENAAEIADTLAGRVRRVGVFTDTPVSEILSIAARVPLDVVQLHSLDYGSDDIQRLKAAGLEVWRLVAAASHGMPVDAAMTAATGTALPPADAVLLDGAVGDQRGGTGRQADWSLAAKLSASGVRVVLAGGISAENAAAAAATGCAILDVNSSLETTPGVKSIGRLEAFMSAVRSG